MTAASQRGEKSCQSRTNSDYWVKIATLYYSEGMKQTEIAASLHLSQSFVSRAITRCVKEGVVKISVIQPPNMFMGLEAAIQKRYGIDQAIVVDVADNATLA